MSPENTMAPPTSQKRIDANRQNSTKSTGPRSSEGKSRSRFNGLKHGLAATVAVLPGEDSAAFQARADAVVESFGPQNQVEFDLLMRVAATTWSFERASRAEAARLCHNIRHDAIEREQEEKEEAVALSERLFWDARGPWQVFPHGENLGLNRERRTSWSENPADPNNPALLLVRLERMVAGCRWLLDCWAALRARLEPPGGLWVASDQFQAIRLLGKQPLDAVDDPDVAQICLASARLLSEGAGPDAKASARGWPPIEAAVADPDGAGPDAKAFALVQNELRHGLVPDGKDECGIYGRELLKRPLAQLTPADADAVRQVLRALVDRQTSRLELILARNQEIARADAAEAPDRLAFDPSPDADKLRRYVLSAARLVNQTLSTFVKVRKSLTADETDRDLSSVSGPLSFENSSVVPGPLSFATPDNQAVPAAQCNQAAPEPSAGHGLEPIPSTEPDVWPEETSDNGQGTEDKGQSTRIPRTEPKRAPDGEPKSEQPTTDNGPGRIPRTEPKVGPDATSNVAHRITSSPEWPQIRQAFLEQINDRFLRLNQTRQHPPRAPAQRTSRESQHQAGRQKGNKGRRK